jgi:hypothetical protein
VRFFGGDVFLDRVTVTRNTSQEEAAFPIGARGSPSPSGTAP